MKTRIAVAIATLLIAAVAVAQPAPQAPAKLLANYLQLTPDQISAWQQINKETAATVQPLASNARDLRTQLDAALAAPAPDPAAIGHLAMSLRGVQDQIRNARQAANARRLAILSADQKTKFDAFQSAAQFIRQSQRRAR